MLPAATASKNRRENPSRFWREGFKPRLLRLDLPAGPDRDLAAVVLVCLDELVV
jgi:hypothetical protein